MTILQKNRMTSLGVPNNKHLQINAQLFTEQNRARSERALSLALPQNSLLDFYDPQQQQCNSVALLPASINGVVRRHSSHCYPMFDEKQYQSQPQAQPQHPLAKAGVTTAVPNIFLYDSTQNDDILMENLSANATASTTATTALSLPLPTIVNKKQQQNDLPALNPPPPIPKRTFRGKCMNSVVGATSLNLVDSSIIENSSPVEVRNKILQQKHQQQQQQQENAFIYPQTIGKNIEGESVNYMDIQNADSLFGENVLDMSAISDDDRLSLENSVFDESVNTTPVKVNNTNNKITNKALTALAVAGNLSNAAKRANRASNSTVDSAITSSSMSSGYGSSSHSENLPTTANVINFRSRFSSVDTEASLDLGVNTEKSNDIRNQTIQNFNNCVNNNEDLQYNNHINNSSTSSSSSFDKQHLNPQFLPMVPQRKQQHQQQQINCATRSTLVNGQKQQQQQGHNSLTRSIHKSHSSNDSKAPMTVSASTSTSSTASAGSGCMTGSSMSLSTATASASNTTISPLTYNAPSQMEMKNTSTTTVATPPLPPARNVPDMEIKKPLTPATKSVRNKLGKNRPPPIVYPKLHQRQDSNLSSDSFSGTSSPGYNSNAPLLQNAARINRSGPSMNMRHQDSNDSFNMTASRYAFSGLGQGSMVPPAMCGKFSCRQDSNISSDSFSQTSSPGYNTKILEAPLIPSLSVKRLCSVPAPIVCKQKLEHENLDEVDSQAMPMSPLTKYATPTSLQTIVRFQNGAPNTMSLQHQIINRRKSSNPYITNGRLKFRLFQVLLNAFALLAIAGGLAAYFNAYPTIKFVNKTIINTIHVDETASFGKNPAPGTCLPIIVKFCQGPQIPYNYTVFPNYIGHFGQLETQVDLESYEALVDVRCYELVSLFLCTLFVPKCGSTGATVPPCKTLCTETMRRCGFFFDVFGLSLPEYLNCKLFKDFESAEDCVGLEQVRDVMIAASNPVCDGFQCDQNRCVPKSYVCDGHLDCMDQTDEANCERCTQDEIYCGEDNCISSKHICDGVIDCPHGQDERNCIRLSDRNGDLGKGVLEVFRINTREWTPACVKNWDRAVSPTVVCSMLGYSSVNATSVVTQKTHRPLLTSVNVSSDIWKMYAKKRSNLMLEFSNCKPDEDYPIAELTCSNYECGKVKRERHKPSVRIIGGSQANPGSWPFLAAILGGPEKIFYCAGVLISDQWVLTASHCIGNHTIIDLEDWTIQLGVTRRNSFTYTGQKVKVKAVIPHPQYNTAIAHDNDIALFQLATRVSFHEHLLPVCLPPQGLHKLPAEQLCTVIGWGKRQDKDPKSTYEPIVNEVQVPIIKRQQCDEWLDNLTVSDGMICAGYEEGGRDACQGDSGGPLLCPYPGEKDRWFVGGIVSWGIMCAHPKLPGVYANVIKYVPWIQEQMQKYSKPVTDDKYLKFDVHPGGPDILSNIGTNLIKTRKQMNNSKRSRKEILNY